MGETFELCLPVMEDGVKNVCPVECKKNQEHCMSVNYDVKGKYLNHTEKCITKGGKCPCGSNSIQCKEPDGSGLKYCEPKWDEFENKMFQCPISCKATETFCSVPAFSGTGEYTNSNEYCAANGTKCDCKKGQGAKSCTFEGGFVDCIPASEYCPVACSGAKPVQCPSKDNYKKDGTYVGSTPPAKGQECAAKISDCKCGTASKMCTDPVDGGSWCEATAQGCPLNCNATEKMCTLSNFDKNGSLISGSDKCVPLKDSKGKDSVCPCGTNSVKCSIGGQTTCLPSAFAKESCPCKANEQACYLQDYDKSGKAGAMRTVCAAQGASCPCGKNANSCADAQDEKAKICVPKFGKAAGACPKPCGPTAEAAGNATCVKNNLDKKGNPTGEEVSCVQKGKCAAGRGQKKCPSGATISSSFTCKNIYGVDLKKTGGRRLAAVKVSASRQTSSLSFTLNNLKGTSKDAAAVKVKLDSILQLQGELKSTFSMVKSGTQASMLYKISNLGTSAVAPSKVADKLRGYLNSGNKDVKTALATLGTVVLGKKGCCSLSSDVKAVVDKTTTKAQKKVIAEQKKTTTKAPVQKTTTKAPVTNTKKAGLASTSSAMQSAWLAVPCIAALVSVFCF